MGILARQGTPTKDVGGAAWPPGSLTGRQVVPALQQRGLRRPLTGFPHTSPALPPGSLPGGVGPTVQLFSWRDSSTAVADRQSALLGAQSCAGTTMKVCELVAERYAYGWSAA